MPYFITTEFDAVKLNASINGDTLTIELESEPLSQNFVAELADRLGDLTDLAIAKIHEVSLLKALVDARKR